MTKEEIENATKAVKQQAAAKQEPIKLHPAKDALPVQEAEKIKVLIRLDIARLEFELARVTANINVELAHARMSLADIDRRAANVEYPQPPAEPAKK